MGGGAAENGVVGANGAATHEGSEPAAALHVIILGSGGGPLETNVTALLVRSVASGWGRGSIIAVDAGVHLGAIKNILADTQPPDLGEEEGISLPYTLTTGPFAGLELPNASPSANASHIHSSLIDTYLITHPHLDHISGFVINTAGLPGTRPKRLAGLPSTIAAFKTHIFNNVIWPNLSDENNGAGLVTYMRLVEGGSPALGEGDGRGYLEISDGLAVKTFGVSHGHCIERHSHRGSTSSQVRHSSFDASMYGPGSVGMGSSSSLLLSPRGHGTQPQQHHLIHQNPSLTNLLQQAAAAAAASTSSSTNAPSTGSSNPQVPAPRTNSISISTPPPPPQIGTESVCVYDSSAYFIRDVATGREILVFGDVEPDSISLSPRSQVVWAEAAPKIASGKLVAIFIECSYDDSQAVDRLFGHLTPRFIDEEMRVLAAEVAPWRARTRMAVGQHKRKREGSDAVMPARRRQGRSLTSNPAGGTPTSVGAGTGETESPVSPKTLKPPPPRRVDSDDGGIMSDSPRLTTPTAELSLRETDMTMPTTPISQDDGTGGEDLRGLKVVIIHVKDKMNDAAVAEEKILEQLRGHEAESRLGVEYIISSVGQDLYL
ncbi:hypothetical protein OQA88_74 [Cercophora sp. LCS_1]